LIKFAYFPILHTTTQGFGKKFQIFLFFFKIFEIFSAEPESYDLKASRLSSDE